MNLTMICSKAIDDVHIIPECLLIFSRYKRRLDPNSLDANPIRVIFCQEQVMRRYFTSDLDSSLFRSSNHKHLQTMQE